MEAPTIPKESKNDDGRVKFIKYAAQKIGLYANASKKAGDVLDPSTNAVAREQLEVTGKLLSWLESSVDMNPSLKSKSNIGNIIGIIYQKPEIHFPEVLRERARNLIAKWETENWGAPAAPEPQVGGGVDVEDGSDIASEEDLAAGPSRRRDSASVRSGNTRTHYPPPSHPIWGQRGIFNGLAKRENLDTGRMATVFNDRLLHLKKDPKVYGHNGLEVGQWFPSQLAALFQGAVGSSQGGISGHTAHGAYSIVISNAYEDLDTDHGETLYYSGSGSHNNTDPNNHAESTNGTKSLKASYYSGKPVRVMRTASKSPHSPSVGFRYDGLYKVVSMNRPRNSLGGLYEQFRLERLDENRRTLEECRQRPTVKEQRDYADKDIKYW